MKFNLFLILAFCCTDCSIAQRVFTQFRRDVILDAKNCSRRNGAAKGDTVTVHYVGRLAASGKQFDSSRERGDPITFKLGQKAVIKGWEVGLLGTCEGETLLLEIPSQLGYGRKGAGHVIPPNADLEFEVTLEKLQKTPSRNLQPPTAERQRPTEERPRRIKVQQEVEFVQLEEKKNCDKKEKSRDKDIVSFDYTGSLPNGQQFSSSKESGPITIEIGKTGLDGWDIALSGLCVGESRRAIIPSYLAYGNKGVEDKIPPNSNIILDIKLLHIQDRVTSFLERFAAGNFNG